MKIYCLAKRQSRFYYRRGGDVRDIYKDLTELPFDGIGLDFIEGKETVHLMKPRI